MSSLPSVAESGKPTARHPFSRLELLAAVACRRVPPDVASRYLDVVALLQRKGVEPNYYGVLEGVASGTCSRYAANRWFAAERAVRRAFAA